MEYKERLERATLMAMQGLLANPNYSTLDESTISFESVVQAKDIIQLIDQQFPNQEPQETQEPKRGDIVWVKDKERIIAHFVKRVKEKIFVTVDDPFEDCDNYPYYDGQVTTKNPYTDESTRT